MPKRNKKQSAAREFFLGTKGKEKKYQNFSGSQRNAMDEFLQFARGQLGQGGITNPQQIPTPEPLQQPENLQYQPYQTLPVTYRPLNFDVEPLVQQAQAQFQQQTIPSIAERFTAAGAGSQGSSAFAQQLGGAGTDLQRNLAALRSQVGYQTAQQNEQNRLNVGQFNVGAGLNTARLNEGNRLAYGQQNADQQFRFGGYNQQLPFQFQQQNIANLLSAQQGRLGNAGQFGQIGLQQPYSRAYFPGQPGALQGLASGIGQGLGTAASLLPFLL